MDERKYTVNIMIWINEHKVDTSEWHRIPSKSFAAEKLTMIYSQLYFDVGQHDHLNAATEWCNGNGSTNRYAMTRDATWLFEDEKDALLFSLKWSNKIATSQ